MISGNALRSAHRVALALGLLLAGSTAFAPAAPAVAPYDVPARVTDPDGVLGEQTQDVEDRITLLYDQTGYQLFVVYVDTFDGLDGTDWANATAARSGLGPRDVLLAVATDAQRFGLSVDSGSGLGADDVDAVDDAARAELRSHDWAGAAFATADAVGAAAGVGAPAWVTVEDAATGRGGLWSVVLWSVVALALIALVVVVVTVVRRRSRAAALAGPDAATLEALGSDELERRAGAALVALDDRLRAAALVPGSDDDSLGAGSAYRALGEARSQVRTAFLRLADPHDDVADPEVLRRADLVEVLTTCSAVSRALGPQTGQHADGHDDGDEAARRFDDADRRAAAVGARIEPARARLTALGPPSGQVGALVATNPDRAARLVAEAGAATARGRAALTARGRANPSAHADDAEDALARAELLLAALDRAVDGLAAATTSSDRALGSIVSSLAATDRLPGPGPDLLTAVAGARAAVATARTTQAAGDPLTGLRGLTHAEAVLDGALAATREPAERAVRADALLSDALGRVDAQVRAVDDLVTTRRDAVGVFARTVLADATHHALEARAVRSSDPVAALALVDAAEGLVQDAARLALADEARANGSDGQTEADARASAVARTARA